MPSDFWGVQTFDEIPEPWAAELATRGWRHVRVEGVRYARVAEQCVRHNLRPLWILDYGQHHLVPAGSDCEIGNECNNGIGHWAKLAPTDYAAWVNEVLPVLYAKQCTVYVGAINNFSRAAMDWLRAVLGALAPDPHERLRLSAHRYLDPDMRVDVPKAGFRSIADEERYWLDTVRGYRWIVSEAGIVDAATTTGWWWWKKVHMRRAVDGHRAQAARLRALGADRYYVYQINDGPGPGFDNRCGIRTVDGQWKPTADLPRLV